MSAFISARGLTKRYGAKAAVEHLDFDVPAGSVTGFLGPNGAGKTTTIRMLLGLVRPDGGSAEILGRSYADLPRPATVVGSLLEGQGLQPGRTARDTLRVSAALSGLPRQRVGAALAATGMSEHADSRVGTFSLGMRQRLGVANALLGDPQVLVLDEPANGLDPAGIRWLRGFLREFAAAGKAVLISSHLLAEMTQLVDRVIVISGGRLVSTGTLEEFRGETAVRVRTPEATAFCEALVAAGARVRALDDGALEVRGWNAADIGRFAGQQGVTLLENAPIEADLEARFLEMVASAGGEVAP